MSLKPLFKRTKIHQVSFFVLLFLFFSSNLSFAQDKDSKHFLWSLKSKNNTIYFLGSIHYLKKDVYPLSKTIEDTYNDSKKVVFELDIDDMETPQTVEKILKLGLYPAGQDLKKNISQKTYSLLEKKLSASNIPIIGFTQFKPWFCVFTIAGIELQRLNFDPKYGIDQHFFYKAKNDGKGLIFLESIGEQIDFFNKMTNQQQEDCLKQTLQEFDIAEKLCSEMVTAWKTGDSDKLASIVQESFKDLPDIYEVLFTKRNKKWILKIEELMKQSENVMVIVGSGHLIGKGSVIALLKEKGYELNQK
ncbi:MAG: TraB/GumN family protein [bacterium]